MDTNLEDIDGDTIREVVQSLAEKVEANYIFPDVAEQICAALRKRLQDGDYASYTTGSLLALALTLDLQEVSHDEHLWVKWRPQPLPDGDSPLRLDLLWQEERMLEARLDNYGLHKVERLPGNVGYLDIRYFHRPAWGGDAVAAAMSFLCNTSALIIDLRKCTGGYPGMVSLVCSYLFGSEPVHLNSIYWRDDDCTQQYWTLPYVPGERYTGKPVYVLLSKVTFSAGEEFACDLQARQRAVLVGEKTDGGAHPGASYRLGTNYESFIPVGRAINPLTGADWEGIGVTPDVPVPQEQAFTTAYRLALQAVIAGLAEPPPGPLQTLLSEAQEALQMEEIK